jgi:hypothetical protein
LATQRANIFLPQLIEYIKSIGVVVDDKTSKSTSSIVVNTNGFNDDNPNRPQNINLGQFIVVNLTFNYIKTDVKETFIPKKYDPKYIIQGSYFCNSKNGAGELASNVTPLRCKNGDGKFQTPDTKNLGNYIAIYEIKYSQKLSTDLAKEKERFSTEVYPKIRWNFYWENGKINKISLEKNSKVFNENIKDNGGDLYELKKFMNLPKYSPDTGKYSKETNSYENLVSKYLG